MTSKLPFFKSECKYMTLIYTHKFLASFFEKYLYLFLNVFKRLIQIYLKIAQL